LAFWKWFDRVARADFGGNLLGLVFDWRNWLWTVVPGGGGMTFLWAAVDGRSPLDVWIAAAVVMAALAITVLVIVKLLESTRYRSAISRQSSRIGDAIEPPKDGGEPAQTGSSLEWKPAPDAIEAFAESSLIAERDKQAERMEQAALRRLDAEFKIEAILKALPEHKAVEGTDEFKQIEQQRRQIKANSALERMTEPALRSAWDKLREDIHQKLANGRLVAKGFREPHVSGSLEVEISSAEWRLFTLDNVNSTALRNGEIAYSGLVIRTA
jgi:hypothetical protein